MTHMSPPTPMLPPPTMLLAPPNRLVTDGVQASMLRQLFTKPLSATLVRSNPGDGAGPSSPGLDFGGDGFAGAGTHDRPCDMCLATVCICSKTGSTDMSVHVSLGSLCKATSAMLSLLTLQFLLAMGAAETVGNSTGWLLQCLTQHCHSPQWLSILVFC